MDDVRTFSLPIDAETLAFIEGTDGALEYIEAEIRKAINAEYQQHCREWERRVLFGTGTGSIST